LSKKKDLNDKDKTDITNLIQQAIQEAKNAVVLNPGRSGNWEILARTYQSIGAIAKGADDFAIQSLSQSVVLDPLYPPLRVSLGGLYYKKGDYDSAQKVFELAIAAKNDYANAHYNLAYALKEKGKIEDAINQLSVVLSILDPDSADYETAKKALEDFQSKKKVVETQNGENLTAPEKSQEPIIKPPLELPTGSEPPVTPEPTPVLENTTPEGTVSLSPTPSLQP
jgi:tetratricopeptide (TPR) repeat protein